MKYGNRVPVDLPMEEALAAVREAFKEQGFGILTAIDIQATLKKNRCRVSSMSGIDSHVIMFTQNFHAV